MAKTLAWDAKEADTLYSLLEAEVIPEFYERDKSGMPGKWLGRIRESMAKLTPEFSATRAIREYTESHYLPAASRYHDRAADDGAIGTGLLQWKQDLERHWNTVHFVRVRINTHDGQHFFQADVTPGSLTPDHLRVELYADSAQGESACFEAMIAVRAQSRYSRLIRLFSSGLRNPARERLHRTNRSPTFQCIGAARSGSNCLATLAIYTFASDASAAASAGSF